MTVARLRTEMPQAEFVKWVAYFAEQKERTDREARRKRQRR